MAVHAHQDQITRVIELAASIERVWLAVTDHDEFGRWFRVHLDNPFRVGETTTGHMTLPGLEHVAWASLTEQIEHERLFVFSWPPTAVDLETTYSPNAKVRVEFRFEQIADNRTRLTITESGFLQFPELKRLDILRSNTEGWNTQARNIAAHVEHK
ncbi:MAG: SRPBCC family protein [Planctomycetota bacterium]